MAAKHVTITDIYGHSITSLNRPSGKINIIHNPLS